MANLRINREPSPGQAVLHRAAAWTLILLAGSLGCEFNALAQAVEPMDVVIGQIVSHADGLADVGREIGQGTQACVRAVNASGGVRGRPLRLVSRDDGGEAGAALALSRELLARDEVVALLTPMGRAVNAELLPWATQEGLSVVAPYGAGALSSQAGALPTTFFLRTHPSVEALRLTTQLQTLGVDRAAILYSDDLLGRETLAEFEEAIASTGAAAIALVPLHGNRSAEAVAALAKASPQAVLLATVGVQTQAVLRSLDDLARGGQKIVPYALSTAASEAELRAIGPAARWLVVAQVLPSLQATGIPVVKTYRSALRQVGDLTPSYAGFEGCVAVLTLAKALRSSTEPLTRSGVAKTLRRVGVVDLGGWSVDLADRRRPGSRYTDITLIGPDGTWLH